MKPAHYMIQVQKLEDAIFFYERALGFTVADRHRYPGATLVYMRGPNSAFELELLSPDTWDYAQMPEPGRTHIAFTVEDLDAQHARLTGLAITADPVSDYAANGIHQTRYFYFYDPEGNQIEFLEPYGRYASERS
jgi:lactoylglutathione lyase